MILGVVAAALVRAPGEGLSPLGWANFVTNDYQWGGSEISAADVTDTLLISRRGLLLPANSNTFPLILGEIGAYLKAGDFTIVMDVEFDEAGYAIFLSMLTQGASFTLADLTFDAYDGGWEFYDDIYNPTTGATTAGRYTDDFTKGLTPGVHRIALTRTNSLLAFSVDGASIDFTGTTADNIDNTTASPLGAGFDSAYFGGGPKNGAGSIDSWIRSLTVYISQAYTLLPTLSALIYPTDPEAVLYADGAATAKSVPGGMHLDVGLVNLTGSGGVSVWSALEPGALISGASSISAGGTTQPTILNTSNNTATSTSLTVGLPSQREVGGIMVAFFTVNLTGQTFTLNGGWKLIDSISTSGRTNGWAWRPVDGTEQSLVISWGGSTGTCAALLLALKGADVNNPIGASNKNSGSNSTVSIPAITPQQPNSRALACTFNATSASPSGSKFVVVNNWSSMVLYREPLNNLTASDGFSSSQTASGDWSGVILEIVQNNPGFAASALNGFGGLNAPPNQNWQARAKLPGTGAVAVMPSGVTKTFGFARLSGMGTLSAMPSNVAFPQYKNINTPTMLSSSDVINMSAPASIVNGNVLVAVVSPADIRDHNPKWNADGWSPEYQTYKMATRIVSATGTNSSQVSWGTAFSDPFNVSGAGWIFQYGQCSGVGNRYVNYSTSGTTASSPTIKTTADNSKVVAIITATGAPSAPSGWTTVYQGNSGNGYYILIADVELSSSGSDCPAISSIVPDGEWSVFLVEIKA